MTQRRAIVVGGSLGGLFAGNLLRSIGWQVDVFESTGRELASRGAGIATHAELMAVTKRLGIVVDETIGIAVKSKICLGRDGSVVHRTAVDRIMSSWARFYHPLRAIFPDADYHFGVAAVGVEQDDGGVTVVLADGSRVRADLLVAADGIRSTVRGCLLPEVQPKYAGYVAWRAQMAERAVPPEVYPEIWEHQVFCLPEGEMMIAHPMPGADDDVRPGHRRYNFVWYHPVSERALADLCTDASGVCHGMSIPPPLIRPEVIADIRRIAADVLAPQIARAFCLAPSTFFQAINDLESPRLVMGRVALLGDAAFVARPHVGMGVAKAALDAQCLADEILAAGHDLDVALPRYEAARSLFGRRAVARARWLGAHLEAQNTPREQRSEAALHQYPEQVLSEVGKQIAEIPELAELGTQAH